MGLVKTRRLAAMQKQQKAKTAIQSLPRVVRPEMRKQKMKGGRSG